MIRENNLFLRNYLKKTRLLSHRVVLVLESYNENATYYKVMRLFYYNFERLLLTALFLLNAAEQMVILAFDIVLLHSRILY